MVACRWASLLCKNPQPPPPLLEALENFGCMPLGGVVLKKYSARGSVYVAPAHFSPQVAACRWASSHYKKTQPPHAAAGGIRKFWSHAAGRACTVKKPATPPPLPGALGYFGCMPLGELFAVKIPSPLSPAAAGGFRKFWLHAAGRACTVKMQASLYTPQGLGLLAARAAIRTFVPAGRQNRKEDDILLAARPAVKKTHSSSAGSPLAKSTRHSG